MNKITRLSPSGHGHPTLLHPENIALLRLWRGLCAGDTGNEGIPHKREMTPRAMVRLLPWIGLAERRHGGHLAWRLAGSGLCRLWRRELTGEELFHDWPTFEHRTLLRLLDGALKARRPVMARMRLSDARTTAVITAELLALPLRGGNAPLLLISLAPLGETPDTALCRVSSAELLSLRMLPAAAQTPPAPPMKPARGRTLRIIPGGLS